jgi:hypothetical protein
VPPLSNSTLTVSRAGLGEVLAYESGALCERIAVRFASSLIQIFVEPGSEARHRAAPCKTGLVEAARRAAGIQQHAQRFACRIG